MADEVSDRGIVLLLEAALIEYVERYGLTDNARLALSRLGGAILPASERVSFSTLESRTQK